MCATQKCLILNVSAPHLLVRYVAITHGVLGDAGSVGQWKVCKSWPLRVGDWQKEMEYQTVVIGQGLFQALLPWKGWAVVAVIKTTNWESQRTGPLETIKHYYGHFLMQVRKPPSPYSGRMLWNVRYKLVLLSLYPYTTCRRVLEWRWNFCN